MIEHPQLPVYTARDKMRASDGRKLWRLFRHRGVASPSSQQGLPALLSGSYSSKRTGRQEGNTHRLLAALLALNEDAKAAQAAGVQQGVDGIAQTISAQQVGLALVGVARRV